MRELTNARRSRVWHWLLLTPVLLVAIAVTPFIAAPAAQPKPAAASPAFNRQFAGTDDIADLLSEAHASQLLSLGIDIVSVRRVYALRAFKPAWSGAPDARENAATAMAALARAGEHGLDPALYQRDRLRLWTANNNPVLHDVLLTDAVLRYAHDLAVGRIVPATIYSDVILPAQVFDAVAFLQEALSTRGFARMLNALPPAYPEYGRLKQALAAYRQMANDGDWPRIPAGSVKPLSSSDPRIASLRARLAREDSTLLSDNSDSFDKLVLALRRYQSRNGLEPDAKLGPQTLAMLNIALPDRVAQIQANMERWRWLPRSIERRFVMVNAADATLQMMDEGKIVLRSKVVVGEAGKPTPMFRAEVKEITVNPPWTVPASIARNEILPRLRRDPDYLRSHNMILLNGPADDPHGTRIDWKTVSANPFPYRIQQKPGLDNALGMLKLEMPNLFNVYLHDTPGKGAFDKANRNLSHGCVRVEQIRPLAVLALKGDIEAIEALDDAIAGPDTKRLPVGNPLPVYVLYWTTFVDSDGSVQFRRDIYKRDERFLAALRKKESRPIAECGTATH